MNERLKVAMKMRIMKWKKMTNEMKKGNEIMDGWRRESNDNS